MRRLGANARETAKVEPRMAFLRRSRKNGPGDASAEA